MSSGLYSAVSAMDAAQRRIEIVADNLANLGTTAHKRRTASTASFETLVRNGGRVQRVEGLTTHMRVDFSQGDLYPSDNTFDLALEGDGFFVVDGPEGERYTRNGTFQVDSRGILVTGDGYPVAWERANGAIDPHGYEVVIDGAGNVHQGPTSIGRLRVTAFADPSLLERGVEGYWLAPAGAREVPSPAQVRQGMVERSNAQPMGEVVEMIVAQRSFELAARAVEMIRESYSRLNGPR